MLNNTLHVSAPGSLMLMGEHGILRGYPALVAAVNLRMHVKISSYEKPLLHIHSEQFGDLSLDLTHPHFEDDVAAITAPFQFVKQVLLAFLPSFKMLKQEGMKIHISSEFLPTLGLGSSAALTVALYQALAYAFSQSIDKETLALKARDIIKSAQNGLGSGADVMASVFGGVIYYQMDPFRAEKLPFLPPLVTVYSGSKTATPIVIDKVNTQEKANPLLFHNLFQKIGDVTEQGRQMIVTENWPGLGKLFSAHATLQQELGVSTPLLADIQYQLENDAGIYGAKISGSGLGDCIIGVGDLRSLHIPNQVPVQLSSQGVLYES